MKRFLMLAAVVGGLGLFGFTQNAQAHGGYGGGYRGHYGHGHYRGGFGGGYYGGYRPYVPAYRSGLFMSTPGFSIGYGGYPYGYGYGSNYGYGCGW